VPAAGPLSTTHPPRPAVRGAPHRHPPTPPAAHQPTARPIHRERPLPTPTVRIGATVTRTSPSPAAVPVASHRLDDHAADHPSLCPTPSLHLTRTPTADDGHLTQSTPGCTSIPDGSAASWSVRDRLADTTPSHTNTPAHRKDPRLSRRPRACTVRATQRCPLAQLGRVRRTELGM
jgi:hypothetical protein